jgi:hypothetical protein
MPPFKYFRSRSREHRTANFPDNSYFDGGGFSPVFLTSFSVVIVVVPLGVLMVVSDLLDVFSAQPPTTNEQTPNAAINFKFRAISLLPSVKSSNTK